MKNKSFWKFIDNSATFLAKNLVNKSYVYFPLANEAEMMSAITPELKGDIKKDNNSFLMVPVSRADLVFSNSKRGFWIFLNKENKVWDLTQRRANTVVEAGLLYHKLIQRNSLFGLQAEITNFVPATNESVELMLIKLSNISNREINLTATSALPMFCRCADNLRDHRHVSSLLNRIRQDTFGVIVQPVMSFDERGHKINQTSYFVLGIDAYNQPPAGSFPTLDIFLENEGNLNQPKTVTSNIAPKKWPLTQLHGQEAMGALRFKTRFLKPKQSTYYALILGIADSPQTIPYLFKRFNTINKIKKSLIQTKRFWLNKIDKLSFLTADHTYDNWLRWVSIQPILRKIYGCSFLPDFDYGRGGKGWRDLWQDCLIDILTQPKQIKHLLIANFSGIRIDGTNATIITKKPGVFISDRNKISRVWMDHGLWPLFSLSLYIHQTGDLNILLKKTTYFRDSQILRAKGIDLNWDGSQILKTRQNKIYKSSILEHLLIEHLVSFFNVGPHNFIRLENADWNDALDMAFAKGESVAFSSFYVHNLYLLSLLLERLAQTNNFQKIPLLKELFILMDSPFKPLNYNSVKEKIKTLNKYLLSTKLNVSGQTKDITFTLLIQDLRRKAQWLSKHILNKEWININKQLGFFNGYYDNKSKRLEGKYKNRINMTLTAQVFPILSGIASEQQIKKIYRAAKRLLRDKKLKSFRLNTKFKQPQFDLGRAFAFAYGQKENGAIFSHMCLMFAYALYKRGFAKEGFEILDSLFNLSKQSQISKIYPNLPEYFNLQGEGMYSYLTGSASWYILTLFTQSFGVCGYFGDLLISPKLVKQQFAKSKQISVGFNFAGKRITIQYLNLNKKDFPEYSITNVDTDLAFQMISKRQIFISRKSIRNFPGSQIIIKVFLD